MGKSGGGYCILIVACSVTCFQRAGDEGTTLKSTPPIYLALTASLRQTKVANLVLRVFSLIKIAAATIWKTRERTWSQGLVGSVSQRKDEK